MATAFVFSVKEITVETLANFRVHVPSKDTAAIWLQPGVTKQECWLNVARYSDISREAENL